MITYYKMVRSLSNVDIVVGIPSFNEADSISFVTTQVDKGLKEHFPGKGAAIVNVDNNSPDNTKQAFLGTKTQAPKIYVSTPENVRGKGNNFYNLFLLCQRLGAKTTIVVDADLRSITPEWVKFLAAPVMEGYDFVAPLYSRHKYDGTITNNIVYPLIYGLMGKNIRQPIGGDFGFSGKMVEHWLKQEWDHTTRQFGIDNFMTTHAVFGGYKICQAGLGAKLHKVSQPKLNEMFVQVITTLFENIIKNRQAWEKEDMVEEIPVYGLQDMDEPGSLEIDTEEMKKTATYEFFKNLFVLRQCLSDESFRKMYQAMKFQTYDIDSTTWAGAVYDILYSFSALGKKQEVIDAVKPLYFARVVSFASQAAGLDHEKAEKEIRHQARMFRELKPYLVEKLGSGQSQEIAAGKKPASLKTAIE